MGSNIVSSLLALLSLTLTLNHLSALFLSPVFFCSRSNNSRLASTVFQQFVAADNASERFAGLKRIHGLMPYFMLKAALKISNPVGMI